MRSVSISTTVTFVLALFSAKTSATASSKRGIVYVTPKKSSDDSIWTRPSNDLTWYYNYAYTPTAAFSSDVKLEFVPMLWGAPSDASSTDTAFLQSVTGQLQSGEKITHVLTYNEPDGTGSTGGSNVHADAAANAWMKNIKPLRDDHGIKVGLPATTGSPSGVTWLQDFNKSCTAIDPAGCEADFIPIHWYGNFEGLASHLGQIRSLYPTIPMWITEYALPGASLAETQAFYNTTAEYFDRLDYVERYSYFGAFRSDVSNVGPNAAFLTQSGDLTDIGSWYLGGGATGKVPKGSAGRVGASIGLLVGIALALALWNSF
jgi:Glycosyl hydrolase catalytic core